MGERKSYFFCYRLLVIMWFLFWRDFLFILVLGIDCIILLWYSLGLPYNYFVIISNFEAVSRCMVKNDAAGAPYEPRCEKTGLRGFRPGPTQTVCTSTEDGYWLTTSDLESRGIVLSI